MNNNNQEQYAPWTRDEWLKFQAQVFKEIKEVTRRKNEDYCPDANPFANFLSSQEFGVDPIIGIALRMSDKFQRLKTFCQNGTLSVATKGDHIEDVFLDLIGYSSLALGLLAAKRQKQEGVENIVLDSF